MLKKIKEIFDRKDSIANHFSILEVKDNYFILSDLTLCSVIKIRGADQISVTEEKYQALHQAKTQSILVDNVSIYYYMIHYALPVAHRTAVDDTLKTILDSHIHHISLSNMVTDHYYIVRTKKGQYEELEVILHEAVNHVKNSLIEFQPEVLDTYAIGNFLYKLLNFRFDAAYNNMRFNYFSDNEYQSTDFQNHRFKPEIQLMSEKTRHMILLSIDQMPLQLNSKIYHYLTQTSFEFLYFIRSMKKNKAVYEVQLVDKINRLAKFKKYSEVVQNLNKTLNELTTANLSIIDTTNIIAIFHDDLNELKKQVALLKEMLLTMSGIVAYVHNIDNISALLSLFLNDYTMNFNDTAENVAYSIPLSQCNISNKSHKKWGIDPHFITLDKKISPFSFFIDDKKDALGNCFVFGGSGSGKTTLMSFILNNYLASSESNRIISFDQLGGLHINATTFGKQVSFDSNFAFNPFKSIEKNEESILYLASFFEELFLFAQNAKQLSAEDRNSITHAVKHTLYADQLLNTFYATLPNNIANALELYGTETFGSIISEHENKISESRYTNYDFTNILNNYPKLAGAAADYLINSTLLNYDDYNKFIFIDEAPAYLNSTLFQNLISKLFKQVRKKSALLIMATQSATDFVKNTTLIDNVNNIASFVFFQGCGISEQNYELFGLTKDDLYFLNNKSFSSRYILLKKQNKDSVILDVNLSHLGKMLKLYSSSADDINKYNANPRLYLEDV